MMMSEQPAGGSDYSAEEEVNDDVMIMSKVLSKRHYRTLSEESSPDDWIPLIVLPTTSTPQATTMDTSTKNNGIDDDFLTTKQQLSVEDDTIAATMSDNESCTSPEDSHPPPSVVLASQGDKKVTGDEGRAKLDVPELTADHAAAEASPVSSTQIENRELSEEISKTPTEDFLSQHEESSDEEDPWCKTPAPSAVPETIYPQFKSSFYFDEECCLSTTTTTGATTISLDEEKAKTITTDSLLPSTDLAAAEPFTVSPPLLPKRILASSNRRPKNDEMVAEEKPQSRNRLADVLIQITLLSILYYSIMLFQWGSTIEQQQGAGVEVAKVAAVVVFEPKITVAEQIAQDMFRLFE